MSPTSRTAGRAKGDDVGEAHSRGWRVAAQGIPIWWVNVIAAQVTHWGPLSSGPRLEPASASLLTHLRDDDCILVVPGLFLTVRGSFLKS